MISRYCNSQADICICEGFEKLPTSHLTHLCMSGLQAEMKLRKSCVVMKNFKKLDCAIFWRETLLLRMSDFRKDDCKSIQESWNVYLSWIDGNVFYF